MLGDIRSTHRRKRSTVNFRNRIVREEVFTHLVHISRALRVLLTRPPARATTSSSPLLICAATTPAIENLLMPACLPLPESLREWVSADGRSLQIPGLVVHVERPTARLIVDFYASPDKAARMRKLYASRSTVSTRWSLFLTSIIISLGFSSSDRCPTPTFSCCLSGTSFLLVSPKYYRRSKLMSTL